MIQGRQKSSKAVHSSSPFGDSVPNHGGFVLPLVSLKGRLSNPWFSEGGTFFGGVVDQPFKKKHTVFVFSAFEKPPPADFSLKKIEDDLLFLRRFPLLEKRYCTSSGSHHVRYIYIYMYIQYPQTSKHLLRLRRHLDVQGIIHAREDFFQAEGKKKSG